MLTRRKLLVGGLSAALLISLGGLYLQDIRKREAAPPSRKVGSTWFELSSSETTDGDIVLEFVDEYDKPLDFNVFLIWEPTGKTEEVSVKNGKLVIPRRKIEETIDMWKDEHRRTDTPSQIESPLLVLAPVSLQAEALPYTAVINTPRLQNKRYVVRGSTPRKKAPAASFSGCPEGRVVYISDANLREYVPAVAAFDRSSKSFIENVDFSYHVIGSALRLQVYGGTSLGYGTDLRIWSSPSWSTGDLISHGGTGLIPIGLDESAAVMFYSTIWRYIVYEVYDIYTCTKIDERADLYMLDVAFEKGNIVLRATNQPPSVLIEPTEVSETRRYAGVDGKSRYYNMLRYVEIMMNEPLIDTSLDIRLGGAWPVGRIIDLLGFPFSHLIRELHIGFSFSVYGGIANYVATVSTDAGANVNYGLEIRRARHLHHLKDYTFRPLNTIATLVD